VRAIYGNELGWFDGQAENLYQLSHTESASRLVQLLGGEARVLGLTAVSVEKGEAGDAHEYQWALYLLKLLHEAGADDAARGGKLPPADVQALKVRALRGLAGATMNTNGRGYLLQVAEELEREVPLSDTVLGQAFIDAIPIPLIMEVI